MTSLRRCWVWLGPPRGPRSLGGVTDVQSTQQIPLKPVGVAVTLDRRTRPSEKLVRITKPAPESEPDNLQWKQTSCYTGRMVPSTLLVPADLLGGPKRLRSRQSIQVFQNLPLGPFESLRDHLVQSKREIPEPLNFPSRGKVTIPTMEEMFTQELLRHPRAGAHQDLTANLTISAMMGDFAAFMTNAIAQGTWSGYGRVWSDLHVFASQVGLPPCEYTAALFLRRRMLTPYTPPGKSKRPRYYLVSSIYNQSKSLLAIGNRMSTEAGWRAGFLSALNRILVKMGAKIPQTQAQPISKKQVYDILENPQIPEEQRMICYLTCKVAGRADDMSKAFADDTEIVTHKDNTYVVIRWRPRATEGHGSILTAAGSGCQKNISHGLGYSCVVDCGAYLPRVRAYLRTRKGRPLSTYTTEQMTAFLKRHVSPILSAHSMKRGALQYLLEQGITLRLIGEMARHAHQLEWLPMASRVYLPSVLLALAIGTQEATKLL